MARHSAAGTPRLTSRTVASTYFVTGVAIASAGIIVAGTLPLDLVDRQAGAGAAAQTGTTTADVTLLASTQATTSDSSLQALNPGGFVEYLRESYALRSNAVDAVTEYLRDGFDPQPGFVAGIPSYIVDGWTVQPDAIGRLTGSFTDPEVYTNLAIIVAPHLAAQDYPGIAAAVLLVGSNAVFGDHSIPSHYLSGYATLGPPGIAAAAALVGSEIIFGADAIPSTVLDSFVHSGVYGVGPVILDLSSLIFADGSIPSDAAKAYFDGFPLNDPQNKGVLGLGRFALDETLHAFDVLTGNPSQEEETVGAAAANLDAGEIDSGGGAGDTTLAAKQGAPTSTAGADDAATDNLTTDDAKTDDVTTDDLKTDDLKTDDLTTDDVTTDDGDAAQQPADTTSDRGGDGLGGLRPFKKLQDVVKKFTGGGGDGSDADAGSGNDGGGEG